MELREGSSRRVRRAAPLVALVVVVFLAGWFGHSLLVATPEVDGFTHREPTSGRAGAESETAQPLQTDPALRGRDTQAESPEGSPAAARHPVPEASRPVAASNAVRVFAGPEGNGVLRVLVQEPDGTAVAGFTVRVSHHEPTPASKELSTDSLGRAEFSGLEPGRWSVECSLPQGRLMSNLSVFAGYTTESTLVLPTKGGALEGVVTDVVTGPVVGDEITLSSMEGGAYVTLKTQTDRDGEYRFEGLRPGTWGIHLASRRSVSGGSSAQEVFVSPGRPTRRDFVVGPLLRGKVRNSRTGAAVIGARVECRQGGNNILDQMTTDSEGAYSFRGLRPGTFTLLVSKEGYGFTILNDVVVPAEGLVRDIELSEAAKLRLRVVDAQGNPVGGNLGIGITPKGDTPGTGLGTDLRLDADGLGSYDQILPGSYVLSFRVEGIGVASTDVTLLPGENSLEVQLKPK